MRQRLSAKKLVVAIYLQCIPAGDAGDYMGPERRALPRRRGRPRQIPRDPASAVRDRGRLGLDRAYFTFGSYVLPIGLWVVVTETIPELGAVPAVLTALFSDGLEGDILVALFLLLAQQLKGNVLVPRIMGSSVGVRPLLVLFATLSGMLLFERRQEVPVVEVVVERAPGIADSGEEPAGLRGCSAGGEG